LPVSNWGRFDGKGKCAGCHMRPPSPTPAGTRTVEICIDNFHSCFGLALTSRERSLVEYLKSQ
jgi:hypothetical protein